MRYVIVLTAARPNEGASLEDVLKRITSFKTIDILTHVHEFFRIP